jgi:multiple antibiotic resistance protein
MMPEAALASFIAALFSIMNPIGNVGVFAGMTTDRPRAEVRQVAWTCAFAVAVTLLIVAWSGSFVLAFFGITVDSLRAAGGVIVLLIGLRMLFNNTDHQHSSAELEDASRVLQLPLCRWRSRLWRGRGPWRLLSSPRNITHPF